MNAVSLYDWKNSEVLALAKYAYQHGKLKYDRVKTHLFKQDINKNKLVESALSSFIEGYCFVRGTLRKLDSPFSETSGKDGKVILAESFKLNGNNNSGGDLHYNCNPSFLLDMITTRIVSSKPNMYFCIGNSSKDREFDDLHKQILENVVLHNTALQCADSQTRLDELIHRFNELHKHATVSYTIDTSEVVAVAKRIKNTVKFLEEELGFSVFDFVYARFDSIINDSAFRKLGKAICYNLDAELMASIYHEVLINRYSSPK